MYQILPFQFARFPEHDVLMVNESGEFLFLQDNQFDLFIRHELDEETDDFLNLKGKLFLAQNDSEVALQKLAAKYRTRKAFLREFTSLHMMVITLRCNQRCEYCQVSCAEHDAYKYDMPVQVAEKIVDMVFESPTKHPKIEFQGGEPLLNWDVIVATVDYAEKKAALLNKKVCFVICTNLIGITEDQLLFCRDHNITISTSLDGPEDIHDKCRIVRTGGSSYNRFLEKLEAARRILGHDGVDALMTTTAFSLHRLEEVIDEYLRQGMNGIFIRSLNPYGFAAEQASKLGYGMTAFTSQYLRALQYILEKNKTVFFPEHFATLLLSRMLTPFSTGFVDLQSPSGAGISGVIYDFDGSVFPSDEARMLARMGDRHFCLGNVLHDSYQDIFAGTQLKQMTATACVETTPSCAWCVYQAYCGTDPVRNYLETGDELRTMENSPFCIKHKTLFTGLFQLLKNITDEENSILWSWITRNPALVAQHAHN